MILECSLDRSDEDSLPALCWSDWFLNCFQPRFQFASWERQIYMATSCSGTGAPYIGMNVLGFPVQETFSADPNPVCIMELMQNTGCFPEHNFALAADQIAGTAFAKYTKHTAHAPCGQHGQTCWNPTVGRITQILKRWLRLGKSLPTASLCWQC